MWDFSVKSWKIKSGHWSKWATFVQIFNAFDDISIVLNNPKGFYARIEKRFGVVCLNLTKEKFKNCSNSFRKRFYGTRGSSYNESEFYRILVELGHPINMWKLFTILWHLQSEIFFKGFQISINVVDRGSILLATQINSYYG